MNIHTKINHKAKIKKMQLTFSFDLTNNFDMDDEVFLVHNIIEEMNLQFSDSAYSNKGRKPVVESKTMLKILVAELIIVLLLILFINVSFRVRK